jgi:hypothetical protein
VLSTGLTGVTGLTGAGHRSDWCSTGSKPCKFPLCVLVCFGSEGCLLVPRSSSTPVGAWAWPTWVVSRRRVLQAVFVLLEFSSPSRRIFIGSHSLPPSLVRRIGPSPVRRPFAPVGPQVIIHFAPSACTILTMSSSCPRWRFSLHEVRPFTLQSPGVFLCSTSVLATIGSDFIKLINTNKTP